MKTRIVLGRFVGTCLKITDKHAHCVLFNIEGKTRSRTMMSPAALVEANIGPGDKFFIRSIKVGKKTKDQIRLLKRRKKVKVKG